MSDDDLAAVLLVGFAERRTVFPEMIEALKLLANAAGASLSNVREYTAERHAAATNLVAATTDELTRIGNRRAANERLDRLRPGDTVAMIDLDRFKDVNDRDGHAAGDQVLIDLAAHLAEGLRGADQVYRFGGEEFLVVLPVSPAADANSVMERLLSTWRAADPVTTFSAGVATVQEGETSNDALARADAALFDAKRTGKDRCVIAPHDRLAILR